MENSDEGSEFSAQVGRYLQSILREDKDKTAEPKKAQTSRRGQIKHYAVNDMRIGNERQQKRDE